MRLDKKGPWGPICGDGWGVPEAIVSHITDFSLSSFQFFLLLFCAAGANFEIYVFVGNERYFQKALVFCKMYPDTLKAISTQFLFDLLLLDSRPRFKSRRSIVYMSYVCKTWYLLHILPSVHNDAKLKCFQCQARMMQLLNEPNFSSNIFFAQ